MATILATTRNPVEATSIDLPSWQTAMKRAIRDGRQLCEHLGVPAELASADAESEFPLFVPLEYAARMEPRNPLDPLLKQVLGTAAETGPQAGGVSDPVGDLPSQRSSGLLQKYARRVLVIASGTCAVHCRYCFRRHFPYDTVPKGIDGLSQSLEQIANDSSIDEVILSGGDPLSIADPTLAWVVEQLNAMSHIRRLRIHTRFPVVIPQRICQSLIEWVGSSTAQVVFVMHFNHAREVDANCIAGMRRLHAAGATVLNQAVLLRGVNDSVDAQTELCMALVNCGVMPYYLHQLDPVRGAMHFDVPDDSARAIMDRLRASLPGYAVPKLVREIAGRASKTPV